MAKQTKFSPILIGGVIVVMLLGGMLLATSMSGKEAESDVVAGEPEVHEDLYEHRLEASGPQDLYEQGATAESQRLEVQDTATEDTAQEAPDRRTKKPKRRRANRRINQHDEEGEIDEEEAPPMGG